jgi:hypothetical protein
MFFSFHLISQVTIENELFGSAGAQFNHPTCNLSFSIGETVTNSFNTPNISITQGFQQSFKWKSTNSLSLTDYNNSGISIYPNPFVTTITILNENNMQFDCQLYDITNRLIADFDINEQIHSCDLSYLPSGTYQLVFINKDFNHVTYPLIKIN